MQVPARETYIPLPTQKKDSDFGRDSLDLTTRLLHVNPEFYTVWNYRRRILLNGIFPTRYLGRSSIGMPLRTHTRAVLLSRSTTSFRMTYP